MSYVRAALYLAMVTGVAVAAKALSDTEVYLNPAGNDATGDGTAASPFATVDRALIRLGDASGSILFQPGVYSLATSVHLPLRPSAGNAGLTLRSSEGKSTVQLHFSGLGDFALGVSSANVTVQELQFHSGAPKVINVEMSARNLVVRNCTFHQASAPFEASTAIVIDGNLAPKLEKALIQDNTFIGPKHAALEILKPVEFLHFIGNTIHLPPSAHGLSVATDGYSGIVVDNNIFHQLGFANGQTVLMFTGKGKGTRINLNCFSSSSGLSSVIPSSKLATNTLLDLQLPFRDLVATDPDPGASLRGPCFDVFAQVKMSVLPKP